LLCSPAGHSGPGSFRDISTWVQYQPLGVAGIISPWNFPMNDESEGAAALSTGNTAVFKPASLRHGRAFLWRSF
jgi:aldehyde dehydrogenase (NAD+)